MGCAQSNATATAAPITLKQENAKTPSKATKTKGPESKVPEQSPTMPPAPKAEDKPQAPPATEVPAAPMSTVTSSNELTSKKVSTMNKDGEEQPANVVESRVEGSAGSPPPTMTAADLPPEVTDAEEVPKTEEAAPAEAEAEKKEEEAAPAEAEKKEEEAAAPAEKKQWSELKELLPIETTEDAKAKRTELFKSFDPNGTGYLSLAEVDHGCRNVVQLHLLTEDLAPILMRAFTAAKGVRQQNNRTKKQGEDFVERCEFRLLFVAIHIYFSLWEKFSVMDADGDRRVSHDEFQQAMPVIQSWGIENDEAEMAWTAMDADDSGKVLFKDFTDYVMKNGMKTADEESDLDQ